MVRLMGAILVATGCAWMGFSAAAALGAQVRALEDMANGLHLLEQELELNRHPLPQLMQRLIPRSSGPAKELFQGCAQALDSLAREEFSIAWRRLVVDLDALGEAGQLCLLPLGDTLGRCGCEEQCQTVAAICRRLEGLTSQAQEERRRQGKVYQTLGLSGGAFLIILLI